MVICIINITCRLVQGRTIVLLSRFPQVKHIGATVYSSSRDKTIKAWHQGKNDPLLTFEGHRLVVTAIDLNDGKTSI